MAKKKDWRTGFVGSYRIAQDAACRPIRIGDFIDLSITLHDTAPAGFRIHVEKIAADGKGNRYCEGPPDILPVGINLGALAPRYLFRADRCYVASPVTLYEPEIWPRTIDTLDFDKLGRWAGSIHPKHRLSTFRALLEDPDRPFRSWARGQEIPDLETRPDLRTINYYARCVRKVPFDFFQAALAYDAWVRDKHVPTS